MNLFKNISEINFLLSAIMIKTKSESLSLASCSSVNLKKAISLNKDGQIVLRIRAKPGAKQSCVTDFGNEEIGVALAAPPREGQANQELLDFLIGFLNLKKSEIGFEKGAKSKSKVVLITSQRFKAEQFQEKFLNSVKGKS